MSLTYRLKSTVLPLSPKGWWFVSKNKAMGTEAIKQLPTNFATFHKNYRKLSRLLNKTRITQRWPRKTVFKRHWNKRFLQQFAKKWFHTEWMGKILCGQPALLNSKHANSKQLDFYCKSRHCKHKRYNRPFGLAKR